jgi:hypothetical protein
VCVSVCFCVPQCVSTWNSLFVSVYVVCLHVSVLQTLASLSNYVFSFMNIYLYTNL